MRKNYFNLGFIKSIAILTMVVDHLKFIYPELSAFFYIIGRFSFICFGFILSVHACRFFNLGQYSSAKRYLKNLVIFLFLSEIPYQLLVYNELSITHELNIMFTLLLSFIGCFLFSKGNKAQISLFIILTLLLNNLIQYGFFGVMAIISMYLSFNLKGMKFIYLTTICSVLSSLQYQTLDFILDNFIFFSCVSVSILIALNMCFWVIFSNRRYANFLNAGKWAWWFYPIHLLLFFFWQR